MAAVNAVINQVINCCNAIISAIGFILQSLILLLPVSPFKYIMDFSIMGDYADYLCWIIPIPEILSTFELWIACIILYYAYQGIMRWIKMIG